MASGWPKKDEGLIERMDAALADAPVRRKNWFGTVSWFFELNGQMFAGAWGDGLMARVGEDEARRLIDEGAAGPFDPSGTRAKREYVLVAADAIIKDRDLSSWLDRTIEFAGTLAPKIRKTEKRG